VRRGTAPSEYRHGDLEYGAVGTVGRWVARKTRHRPTGSPPRLWLTPVGPASVADLRLVHQDDDLPQAFSHIGPVNAAWAITEAQRRS
jgi:hypothetical protein